MLIFDRLNDSRKFLLALDLLKISFIIFISFSLVAQIVPYYEGADSYIYGNTAINLADNGIYGFTNELLKETGLWEFVPFTYSKTVHNVAVPLVSSMGMHWMATLAYFLGGHYGLFYLGPIFSILLIIAVDRICINLFGRFVAFFAVILTGTSGLIFYWGTFLYSESIFTFFLIIGIFFLVKFFRNKNEIFILISSSCLVASAFIRINGIISFPIEIFLVLGFLFLPIISKSSINIESKSTSGSFFMSYKKNRKKIFKIILFMLMPWIIFFSFNAAYNTYNFGDPFTSATEVKPLPTGTLASMENALNNLNLDIFNWIGYHAGLILPEKLLSVLPSEIKSDDVPKEFPELGIISLLIIFSAVTISFLAKSKRPEIITFCLFIFGTLAFYSIAIISFIPSLEEYGPTSLVFAPLHQKRYMVPTLPLFYMLLGFIILKIWQINTKKILNIHVKSLTKIFKLGLLALVITFLATSFYDSIALQGLIKNGIVNPEQELEKHFPLDLEGLPEKSVIVDAAEYKAVEMGKIPLFPFTGINFWRINYELDSIPQEPIQTLKQLLRSNTTDPTYILNEGYAVFVFKNHWYFELTYYHYLESEHGIILQDYSRSFCKMELASELESKGLDSKSDEICY